MSRNTTSSKTTVFKAEPEPVAEDYIPKGFGSIGDHLAHLDIRRAERYRRYNENSKPVVVLGPPPPRYLLPPPKLTEEDKSQLRIIEARDGSEGTIRYSTAFRPVHERNLADRAQYRDMWASFFEKEGMTPAQIEAKLKEIKAIQPPRIDKYESPEEIRNRAREKYGLPPFPSQSVEATETTEANKPIGPPAGQSNVVEIRPPKLATASAPQLAGIGGIRRSVKENSPQKVTGIRPRYYGIGIGKDDGPYARALQGLQSTPRIA